MSFQSWQTKGKGSISLTDACSRIVSCEMVCANLPTVLMNGIGLVSGNLNLIVSDFFTSALITKRILTPHGTVGTVRILERTK